MFAISFDARVREDHLIGFYVPTAIAPGAFCQFQVTITLANPGGNYTIVSLFTFTAVVPADRHVIFTVPSSVPLGTYHFTILCTPLSMMTLAASTRKKSAKGAAPTDAEEAINQSVCTLDDSHAAEK
jgi:hypothetical protein